MTSQADMRRGWLLRSYLAVSHILPLIAKPVLRRRLGKGKEDPARWTEKLGQSLTSRPNGPLIWLHAVGLGEVMSLRGLITRLADQEPDASFLVTSTTAASAAVFGRNLPPRTIHQFLPIDAPRYRRAFLDHFRPDLCIWAEQDIWPGFVSDIARRGIPQAIIAARMNARSYQSHNRAKGLYRDLYRAMKLVTAQDQRTADHLSALGANATVTGSLKPSAPALGHDPTELAALQQTIGARTIWAAAPSHTQDEAIAIAAHKALLQSNPTALLIIAPRFLDRREEIAANCDLPLTRRSDGGTPDKAIWLCDTFGDLGLIYRLASAVLIGGTFSDIEGHNPWEAATLGAAILHGPRTDNFSADFAALHDANAAREIPDSATLATTLQSGNLPQTAEPLIAAAGSRTDTLAQQLLALLKTGNG